MTEEERKLDEKWKAERIPQHIRYKRIRQMRRVQLSAQNEFDAAEELSRQRMNALLDDVEAWEKKGCPLIAPEEMI